MPLVTIKLINEVFSVEQKKELIAKVTDTLVDIEGENMRPVTWVVIEEVKSGDWGIGGDTLTADDVRSMQAGNPGTTSSQTRIKPIL